MDRGGDNQGMGRAGASRGGSTGASSSGPATGDSFLRSGATAWQLWGVAADGWAPADLLGGEASGADNDAANAATAPMYAQPHLFPDKGTITALAIVSTNDAAGFATCWVGLARNKIVNGDHYYPDATLAGSFAAITGLGTAARKLRGFAVNIPVAQSGPELMWLIYQSNAGSAAHGPLLQVYGKRYAKPMLGAGYATLDGLALGATVAAAYPMGGGICGYEATWQRSGLAAFNDPANYVVGANFPDAMPTMQNFQTTPGGATPDTGWSALRAIYFTWTRA